MMLGILPIPKHSTYVSPLSFPSSHKHPRYSLLHNNTLTLAATTFPYHNMKDYQLKIAHVEETSNIEEVLFERNIDHNFKDNKEKRFSLGCSIRRKQLYTTKDVMKLRLHGKKKRNENRLFCGMLLRVSRWRICDSINEIQTKHGSLTFTTD